MFRLHDRLAADTYPVGGMTLSRLLLHRDARFPWLILVPERAGIAGLHQLGAADQPALMREIVEVSRALEARFRPDRINVAALGNLVPQLHVHIVARCAGDAAWPGPIWGHGEAAPYAPGAAEALIAELRRALGLDAGRNRSAT
jgi:diadenosine tetraphosphate (Ap4A) HIT family hydrolase